MGMSLCQAGVESSFGLECVGEITWIVPRKESVIPFVDLDHDVPHQGQAKGLSGEATHICSHMDVRYLISILDFYNFLALISPPRIREMQ